MIAELKEDPFILNFQEAEFNNEVRKVEQVASKLQPYLSELTAINGLTLNEALFRDFIGKGELTGDAIRANTVTQLAAASISSKALREAAIKGDIESYYSLHNRMKKDPEIKEVYNTSLNEKGQACVSDETKERFRERYTLCIATKKGMQAYEAHKKMIQAMNDFLEVSGVPARNIGQFYFRAFEQNTISMPIVDYDRVAS